ncbi:S8/S53 family peptidase [Epilithonimonas zeae]|uniref:S8/S53 family peptidase n=1 Tax=Epilithonimonas zeae TaxID=1416779 RepID=UPI00200F5754|nr:S8/S53 family peptidase [Epilithonimonas zeae]UQB68880.1 S8 family peptidase [Epilithonimonas zeae]
MKIDAKYSILIAVLFYNSAFSQNVENSVSVDKTRLMTIIAQQKQKKQRNNILIENLKLKGYKEFIDDGVNEKQLIGADDEGNPLYYTTLNSKASQRIKANSLYDGGSLGLNISGSEMRIGQWDFSKPRLNHELILGKVNYDISQNQTISRHSTHIIGTMVGNNYSNPDATGVAYSAIATAYDWVNDVAEMANEASNNLLVANNSYGFDPIYYQTYQFGKYNETAKNWDQVMYYAPYFQIVKAAGNARGLDPSVVPQVSSKKGYDLLEGAGIAKNVLVVTSVDKNENPSGGSDFFISAFSSLGGTDDGRIKPDISALGQDVYSAIETYNSAYGFYNGTSSATASVSGAIILLQQYWSSLSSVKRDYLWSSSIRALLAHTANDRDALGPDYVYGWGLMDTERATRLMYNDTKSTLIKEDNLQQGGEYRLYVVASEFENQPLVATLAWTDPEGNIVDNTEDDSVPSLVNDLDITILKKDSSGNFKTYYPWKLGGMQNLTAAATRNSDNKVDNIEKVEIDNADGLYQIVIKHKGNLFSGSQNYSLVISGISFCYTDDMYVLTRDKDNIETSNFVGTAKNIKASNVIKSAAQNIVYKASKSVELLPDASGGSGAVGFTAEQGAGFMAIIDPDCDGSLPALVYHSQTDRPIATDNNGNSNTNSSEGSQNVQKQLENLLIYPNPAKTEVNIFYKITTPSIVNITILDLSGKNVYQQKSNQKFPTGIYQKLIQTSGLSAGIYMMVIETSDYKESKKIIIQ